jgi:hypothetical protein
MLSGVERAGPRQIGETTLALEIGQVHDALYLNLEDRDDRHPMAEGHDTITLDEVTGEHQN